MKKSNYFSGPRSDIAKYIFGVLLLGGMIAVAATSPYFAQNLLKGLRKLKKYPNKKIYDTFYKLKQSGFINFYEKNNQIFIALTEKGKRKAGWMQIDNIKIDKTKKWDGKWRILLFDIAEMKRIYREALRGKLMGLGFVMFQKSTWIMPYGCKKEIEMLKSFFGLSNKEVKMLTVEDIGAEDNKEYKKYFKLN